MGVEISQGEDSSVALWSDFRRSRDAGVRARLADRYLDFARIMAGSLYARRPHVELEFGDYLQFARVGLLESIDRYDADKGASFETYAAQRIRGAILSGIQSYSELQEQVAARKRSVAERMESLQDEENSSADVFGRLAELAIGLAVGFALEGTGMYHSDSEDFGQDVFAGLELKQLRQRIVQLVEELSGNQRKVIMYHYLQQLSFEEITGMLKLSRGRISQLHKEALATLRERLRSAGIREWNY